MMRLDDFELTRAKVERTRGDVTKRAGGTVDRCNEVMLIAEAFKYGRAREEQDRQLSKSEMEVSTTQALRKN